MREGDVCRLVQGDWRACPLGQHERARVVIGLDMRFDKSNNGRLRFRRDGQVVVDMLQMGIDHGQRFLTGTAKDVGVLTFLPPKIPAKEASV